MCGKAANYLGLNSNGWKIFLITFPATMYESMRNRPYGRQLMLSNAIGDVMSLTNGVPKIKILVDCQLCKDLAEDVNTLDLTHESLAEARRLNAVVKLILV